MTAKQELTAPIVAEQRPNETFYITVREGEDRYNLFACMEKGMACAGPFTKGRLDQLLEERLGKGLNGNTAIFPDQLASYHLDAIKSIRDFFTRNRLPCLANATEDPEKITVYHRNGNHR